MLKEKRIEIDENVFLVKQIEVEFDSFLDFDKVRKERKVTDDEIFRKRKSKCRMEPKNESKIDEKKNDEQIHFDVLLQNENNKNKR